MFSISIFIYFNVFSMLVMLTVSYVFGLLNLKIICCKVAELLCLCLGALPIKYS